MKFTVTQNKVDLVETSTVNEGEYNATICEFEYSSSYNGLVKNAIFTLTNTGDSYEVPLVDGTCDIPVEVLKSKEYVTVGVYGYEIGEDDELVLRYSPTPARFQVAPGSYKEDVKNPSDITPSQAAILEAEIQKKIDEVDAVEKDIIEKRDSGAFDGPKGDDGADGQDGQDGQDATITVGTTTVNFGQSTSSVSITNSGTSSAAVLDFVFDFAFADGNNVSY